MADGYGIGLFDTKGPAAFADAVTKISAALSGVSGGFGDFGSKAEGSLSRISDAIDKLINKLHDLSGNISNAGNTAGGAPGAPGGGWAPPSPPTGGQGTQANPWWSAPLTTSHIQSDGTTQPGTPSQPTGTTDSSKPSWMSRLFPQQDTGSASGKPTTMAQRAAQSLPQAAVGAATRAVAGSAGNMISSAIQGQTIGQTFGPAFGVSPSSLYVIPHDVLAQSAGDYAQGNYYAMTQMGVAPGTPNFSAIQRGSRQMMALNPFMSYQQTLATQNQMQNPSILQAAARAGISLRPGGKIQDTQAQFGQIYNRLFMGVKPTSEEFLNAMQPGSTGYASLIGLGITPDSDLWNLFQTYGVKRSQADIQGKPLQDLSQTKNVKAAGLDTAGFSQLQATSKKSQLQSSAEPTIATAAKNLNDAATKFLSIVQDITGPVGKVEGIFGKGAGFLKGATGIDLTHGTLSGGISSVEKIPGLSTLFGGGGQSNLFGSVLKFFGGGGGSSTSAAAGSGGTGVADAIKTSVTTAPTTATTTALMTPSKDTPIGMLTAKLTELPKDTALSTLLSPLSSQAVLTSVLTKTGPKKKPGLLGQAESAVSGLAQDTLDALFGIPVSTSTAAYKWGSKAVSSAISAITGGGGGGKKTSQTNTSSKTTGKASGGTGGTSGSATLDSTGAGTGSKEAWASLVLKDIGGIPLTQNNVDNMRRWMTLENSPQNWYPRNNPLNASLGTSAADGTAGYKDLNDAASYTAKMLNQSNMSMIKAALAANASPADFAAAIKAAPWASSHYPSMSTDNFAKIGMARGSQLVGRTQLALLHRGEAVVPAADNYSANPYNRNGAMGGGGSIYLDFKAGSIVLQVPAGSTQANMDDLARKFVAAISKPQILAAVRST